MTMTGLWNDLRFALRGLVRSPGFAAVAVVTLMLGIGATTAVFTLVDGVILKPLPYPDSGELVSVRHEGRGGEDQLPMSAGLYLLYADQAGSFESIAMHRGTVVNLMGDGDPERIAGRSVTPSFFAVLGVDAVVGRALTAEDGEPDAEPVVVLGQGLWQSHFGGDPDIVGRTVDMSGVSRRVVGVMPAGFAYPDSDARLYIPFVVDPARAPLAAFGAAGIARLSETTSVQSANTELEGLLTRLPELFPEDRSTAFLAEVSLRAVVRPLKETIVGDMSRTLWILFGTVGLVLVIACANVANLLLVRAEVRQREVALRVAVGAGRLQLMRAFMSESLLLSAAGGVFGLGLAAAAVKVSTSLTPGDIPRLAEVGVDFRVLGFTVVISFAAALLFGLFPMVRYSAPDLAGQLRDGGGQGSTDGRERHLVRNGLVVAQIGLALMLLVGSGLMLRSFVALRSVDPGFDGEGVMTVSLSVPSAEIPGAAETAEFFRQLRERLEAQPGVEAVGLVSAVPLGGGGRSFSTQELEDHPRGPGERPIFANNNNASPGFFEALGIPLIEGRTFQAGDRGDQTRAAIVSESFARQWWPDASALGRRIDGEPDWFEIVGVVGDVHFEGLEEPGEEMIYRPTVQGNAERLQVSRQLSLVVRVSGDPGAILPVIRREVRALNPRIPISTPRTMDEVSRRATARTSFTVAMLGVASGVALLLGMIGIYGVISYVVSQRTREIGIRMALGASAPEVRNRVVTQGLGLAGLGVAAGLVGAWLMSSVMTSLLFGVSATDPVTYASVALALSFVAGIASWLPAERAAGVDPARALRQD
ncbi:MAG: ABC transporter permease [Longimicrobiales bacterium]